MQIFTILTWYLLTSYNVVSVVLGRVAVSSGGTHL